MAKINALRNLIESATRGARRVSPKISEMASRTKASSNKLRTSEKIGLALAGGAGVQGLHMIGNQLEERYVDRPRQEQRLKQLRRIQKNPGPGVEIFDGGAYSINPNLPHAALIEAGIKYLTQDIPTNKMNFTKDIDSERHPEYVKLKKRMVSKKYR